MTQHNTLHPPRHPSPFLLQIYIRDPEKVDLMTMGVVYSHYYTYMVHTDFSAQQPAAAPPAAGVSRPLGSAAAGTSDSPAATPTAAGEPRGAAAALAASSNGNGVDSPMSTGSVGALSTSSQPPLAGGPHSVEVRRRFSDFEALHRLLKAVFPGYFVPPLPDKSFFDSRFARDSFIKVRQVDLQVGAGGRGGWLDGWMWLVMGGQEGCGTWSCTSGCPDHMIPDLQLVVGGRFQHSHACHESPSWPAVDRPLCPAC
jgi:hypothetical protein